MLEVRVPVLSTLLNEPDDVHALPCPSRTKLYSVGHRISDLGHAGYRVDDWDRLLSSSGYALADLGNPARVILAWVLCGGWALAGAIGYGALAKRGPLSGGEYMFLTRLMHPSIGFLAGWISLVFGFTVPIAAMAKTAVAYGLPELKDQTTAATAASLVILVAVGLHAAKLPSALPLKTRFVIAKLCLIAALL